MHWKVNCLFNDWLCNVLYNISRLPVVTEIINPKHSVSCHNVTSSIGHRLQKECQSDPKEQAQSDLEGCDDEEGEEHRVHVHLAFTASNTYVRIWDQLVAVVRVVHPVGPQVLRAQGRLVAKGVIWGRLRVWADLPSLKSDYRVTKKNGRNLLVD